MVNVPYCRKRALGNKGKGVRIGKLMRRGMHMGGSPAGHDEGELRSQVRRSGKQFKEAEAHLRVYDHIEIRPRKVKKGTYKI